MKKIVLFVALSLIASIGLAQDQGTGIESNKNIITVLIDSSTAKSVWYYFPGSGGGKSGFSETAADPKDRVFNTGDCVILGQLTVSSGTEASDSLHAHAIPIGPNGYVMEGTLYFDWDSHTTRTTEQTGADGYLDWSPFTSVTLGVTTYSFWINLTNKYPPCNGFVFVFDNFTGEGTAINNMIVSLTLQLQEVR